MSTINKKIPRFISDHVAEKDLFGAHSKIADSILNIINSDAEIRTMGILGPWGSGKSTILKLVADQLDIVCVICWRIVNHYRGICRINRKQAIHVNVKIMLCAVVGESEL